MNESPNVSLVDDYFHFWRGWDPDVWLVELIDAIERFNAHVADFCERTQTPLIDLHAFMEPQRYEEAARDFFDVCHFRPRAYPAVAQHVETALRSILPATPPAVAGWRAPVERVEREATEDLRKNIYPVW